MMKGSASGAQALAAANSVLATLSTNTQQMLFSLIGANLQITTDQQFTKIFTGTNYLITNIVAVLETGAVTIACAGGIYPSASKAGTALVAAAQVWTGLTGANAIQVPTLASVISTNAQSATPYFSLTTGSTGAATANIYIIGIPLV